jgi:hypothetical protein
MYVCKTPIKHTPYASASSEKEKIAGIPDTHEAYTHTYEYLMNNVYTALHVCRYKAHMGPLGPQ